MQNIVALDNTLNAKNSWKQILLYSDFASKVLTLSFKLITTVVYFTEFWTDQLACWKENIACQVHITELCSLL